MRKILIIGGDNGGGSAGDELMCEASCHYLKGKEEDILIFVDAQNENWKSPIEGVKVIKQLRKDDEQTSNYKLLRIFFKLYRLLTFSLFIRFKGNIPFYFHGNVFRSVLKEVDVVLFAGCGGLSDKYPINILAWYQIIHSSNELGKKVFISGSGIGPLNNFINKTLVKKIINKVEFITVRDFNQSLNFVKKYSKTGNFMWVPDDAFFYVNKSLFQNSFYFDTKGAVGVNVMSSLFKDEMQLEAFSILLSNFAKMTNSQIYLIAVTHEDYSILRNLCSYNDKFILLPKMTPLETKYVVSKFDFFLTARYHGCVFAASQFIPAISFYREEYWKQKNEGVFEMIGVENNVYRIEEVINKNFLNILIDHFYNRKSLITNQDLTHLKERAYFVQNLILCQGSHG